MRTGEGEDRRRRYGGEKSALQYLQGRHRVAQLHFGHAVSDARGAQAGKLWCLYACGEQPEAKGGLLSGDGDELRLELLAALLQCLEAFHK